MSAYTDMTVPQLRTKAGTRGLTFNTKTKKVDLVAMLEASDADGDGYTTAALAVIFDTNAKALRVVLRKLGLGVGKGRRYNLELTEDLKSNIRTGLTETA
jgi:hypothetical protein